MDGAAGAGGQGVGDRWVATTSTVEVSAPIDPPLLVAIEADAIVR